MPKVQFIDPNVARQAGEITFTPIPVNQYKKTIAEEKANFSDADFLRIYHDMVVIREFETMLNLIKTTGEYSGTKYDHPGPAHLSAGQEAAAVGMAYTLTVEDFIFGSHRSHGEILAKGLSAIQKLNDAVLMQTMESFFDGTILKIVRKDFKGTTKQLGRRFLLYGTLAEIFARETGFNKGLGGSMHAFFTPFGVYPNNAIVGGSGDIAVGAALYKKVNRKPGMVVANIGDASMACGPVWEGISFAAMDQFRTLWDASLGGGLPLIVNVMNNFYGMGGQPRGETMGQELIARIGAGVNNDQMHAERVNGYDPLAVADAFKRKKAVLAKGRGPVLLDTVTYRFLGHSPSDASSYRSAEELEAWRAADAIPAFGARLVAAGVATQAQLDEVRQGIEQQVFEAFALATDLEASPRIGLDSPLVEQVMFSGGRAEALDDREPELLGDLADNPRVKQIAGKSRVGVVDGKPVPKMKAYNLRDAIFEAMLHRFATDPTMIAFGEENRDWGGAFAVYRGLTEALPYHRLFNSPIAEAAIVGAAVGYGMEGGRAVVELMYADFMGRAGDCLLYTS